MTPPLVTLEEHYVSQHIRTSLKEEGKADHYDSFPEPLIKKLTSLDSTRVSDMDAGKVSLQIISHGPLDASPSACQKANDDLATACSKNPARFAAFAMLPMGSPDAAADELTRCVQTHKFVGALINNHLQGAYYDDTKFWPVFARAEELGVPIYIHPTFAADEWMPHYKGNFPDKAAFSMSIAGWGWHSETALHVLRLWASGLFDKYPKLKVVIGHMGEMLPFQLDRIVPLSEKTWGVKHQRDLRTVWNENFWITTSGMFSLSPFSCVLKTVKMDRILYSVDYPFSTNETGLAFVEELEKSGMVSKEELDAICYGNAEKLLGVKVQQ